jgi:hypothetical protein
VLNASEGPEPRAAPTDELRALESLSDSEAADDGVDLLADLGRECEELDSHASRLTRGPVADPGHPPLDLDRVVGAGNAEGERSSVPGMRKASWTAISGSPGASVSMNIPPSFMFAENSAKKVSTVL